MKNHPILDRIQFAWQSRYDGCDKPMAAKGLTSYRYKGRYGWIMIGAKDNADAISEANRSLGDKSATLDKLEVWDGATYCAV
jgi:hypothetical protein